MEQDEVFNAPTSDVRLGLDKVWLTATCSACDTESKLFKDKHIYVTPVRVNTPHLTLVLPRLGPIRGNYDGLVVLTTLTRASLPRPLLARLSASELASDLVTSLTVLFMQEDTDLGQVRSLVPSLFH